jgi:hypothetical protein
LDIGQPGFDPFTGILDVGTLISDIFEFAKRVFGFADFTVDHVPVEVIVSA